MDCILPGSSPWISQARILEWVAIFFSRGSSQARDRSPVSCKSLALQAHSLPLSHQNFFFAQKLLGSWCWVSPLWWNPTIYKASIWTHHLIPVCTGGKGTLTKNMLVCSLLCCVVSNKVLCSRLRSVFCQHPWKVTGSQISPQVG